MTTAAHKPDNAFFAEFLDDFFVECDEHLTATRSALLALEPFVEREVTDRSLLDSLFRSFHSLKGLASMVGVAEVERLAHQMESYLRILRQEQIALSNEALEALVDGTRMIEQIVDAHRAAGATPDIAPLLARLAAIIPAPAAAERPEAPHPGSQAAEPLTLNAEEHDRIAAARARGCRPWQFTFVPSPALAERDINVNSIRARLQSVGEVIRAAPRVTGQNGIAFEFLVASDAAEQIFDGWRRDGVSYTPYDPPTAVQPDGDTATSAARSTLSVAPAHVVRVDIGRLDDLMRMAGELVISRARLAEQLGSLEAALPVADWRALQETTQLLERQLRDLRTGVMRVRMVPIGDLFARMQFVVRDLARELGKQVQLHLSGQSTEIDKFVVERMLDPLLHLVRNAVSHGLEPADERAANGKPPQGTIALRAAAAGDIVTLEIEDDGRGIDARKIAARARELGRLAGDPALEAAQLLDMLCAPGFSTREQADRVSGRGIGMDVVRKTVEDLGGTLTLSTQVGRGTRFTVELPLTLAITDALIVGAGGQVFAVPLPAVREIVQAQASEIVALEHAEIMLYRGEVLPLIRLARRFGLAEAPQQSWYVFVVAGRAGPVGIVVERIAGKREIVVRPIADPLVQIAGIAGATELGDGRLALILDTAALAAPRSA